MLERLERKYRGCSQELRLKALQAFREKPDCTTHDVAVLLGCSDRTVRRWWALYQKDGIDGLLELADEQRDKSNERAGAFVDRIRNGEFDSLEDVRQWLLERDGTLYSRSEAEYLLKMEAGIQPGSLAPKNGRSGTNRPASVPQLLVPAPLLQFLNNLPLTNDTNEWINGFRSALRLILPDVDHIVINIRQTCNLKEPESESQVAKAGITQHTARARGIQNRVVVSVNADRQRHSERLLEEMRMQRRPLENYQPPNSFDYYYEGHTYLGTLFLFRENGRRATSEETIATVDALEPFLIYAIANHIKWYQETRSYEQVFQEGLERLMKEGELSAQEQKVAIFHMLGYSYEEMADLLCISVKTVKKHVNTIHHKTGTRRQRELFARYLSPRIYFATE